MPAYSMVSRTIMAAFVLAAAGVAAPAPVSAQKDKDSKAKTKTQAIGAPVRLGPYSVVPGTATPGGTRKSGVVTEEKLDELNPESVGVLTEKQGGLGEKMWRDTPRSLVAGLLAKLPLRSPSPLLHNLMRRLLLSRAAAPRGLASGESLVSLRAQKLYEMGDLKGAAALWSAVPVKGPDQRRVKPEVVALLLLGRHEEACRARAAHLAHLQGEFLERATAACHALQGNHDKAAVAMGLLREQQAKLSDAFIILIGAQHKSSRARLRKLPDPDGLSLALLFNTKLRLPRDLMKVEHPALQVAIARAKNRPVLMRIAAGEQAFAYSALTPADMGKLYREMKGRRFSPAVARRLGSRGYGPALRARLYKSAAAQTNPAARFAIVRSWWRIAGDKGDEVRTARITAPLIQPIPPGGKDGRRAADAARILFVAGYYERATEWYRLLRAAEVKDADGEIRLGPIAKLAGGGSVRWTPTDLARWIQYQKTKHPRIAHKRIALLFALFEGLAEGDELRPVWEGNIPRPLRATLAAAESRDWRGLDIAARARRRGETVLRVLELLGPGDLGAVRPVALGAAIRSLRHVGLRHEARTLAVEAALRAGL